MTVLAALDNLSAAAEQLRVAATRAHRDDLVLVALLVSAVVLATREGFADLVELREVVLRIGRWGAKD